MKADLEDEYQDYKMVVAQPNDRPYEDHQIAQKLKKLIAEHMSFFTAAPVRS